MTRRAVRKVLIVDDDAMFARALARPLSANREVFTAANSAEALEILASKRPDVALIDVYLQSERGTTLLERIRAQYPRIAVVMMSGAMTPRLAFACANAGANAVYAKGEASKVLFDTLGEIEQGASWNAGNENRTTRTLEAVQLDYVASVYTECVGNLSETARRLDMSRNTIREMLKRHGLRRPV